MNPFPLQLYDSWITELELTAQRDFELTESNRGIVAPGDPNLRVDYSSFNRSEGDSKRPRHWVSVVEIELRDESKSQYPYTFRIKIFGYFRVIDEFAEKGIEHLVKTSGPALLYSSVRELLISLTGRGPYAPVYLPVVTFYYPPTPAAVQSEESVDKTAPAERVEGPISQNEGVKKVPQKRGRKQPQSRTGQPDSSDAPD